MKNSTQTTHTNYGHTSKLTVELDSDGACRVSVDGALVIEATLVDSGELLCERPEDNYLQGYPNIYGIFASAERLIRRGSSDYFHSNS